MNRTKLRVLPFVIALLPVDILLSAVVIAVDIVSLPLRILRGQPFTMKSADTSSVTIQILNWDGLHLLKACLPKLTEAVQHHFDETGNRLAVQVVDNGSRDGSVEYVEKYFPDMRVVALDRNYGYAIGNNKGLSHVRSEIVVLLNNDMLVKPDFLKPLLTPFEDPKVFAVASQVFFDDTTKRREETGKTSGRFEGGFFRLWHDDVPINSSELPSPVFWAGGGACAVDLRKLMKIGGFDSLYHPFYVEDTDISWQAWKRGWTCLFAPKSHVVHRHRGTSRPKFGDDFVDRMIRRNQFLFIWKNVTNPGMMLSHLAGLPRVHGSAMIQFGVQFEILSFLGAIARLPIALWRRAGNLRSYAISDRQVLKMFP